jgi:hypothetical protein
MSSAAPTPAARPALPPTAPQVPASGRA